MDLVVHGSYVLLHLALIVVSFVLLFELVLPLLHLFIDPFAVVFAVVFAILCVGASFGGGNAAQSNQAALQLASMLDISSGNSGTLIGLVLAILVGVVIIGGIKRIASVTEKIVPFMAIIYVLACLFIILSNFSYIDDAFGLIFRSLLFLLFKFV